MRSVVVGRDRNVFLAALGVACVLLCRALMSRFALLMLLSLPGCISAYVSPAPVVPLHSKKGDLSASGLVRPFFPGLGVHAQAAWSPTDEVVLTASSTLTRFKARSEDSQARLGPTGEFAGSSEGEPLHDVRAHSKSLQGELGIGRSFAWAQHRLELLGGAGGGTVDIAECAGGSRYFTTGEDTCSLEWVESESRFARAYGQLHYGIQWRTVEFATGARLSVTRVAFDTLFQQPSDRVAFIPALEPFVMVRLGTSWIKGQVMGVIPGAFDTKNSVDADGNTLDPAQLPYLVVGVHINTDEMWSGRRRSH